MNQKKNAFTLIELLAVIVILAIIALIAVPVIMNIINKANKSAFKDTAYGIINAGELYFAERQLEPLGMQDDVTIQLPDTTKTLELKGEVPTGEILITKDGKIAIFIKNNRYCVTKGINDTDVTVTEDYDTCELPSEENNGGGNQGTGGNTESTSNTLTSLATTSTEVTSIPECIKNKTQCTAGTPVAIKVNETQVYNFYVISESNNEVTLIMNKNLGNKVDWVSEVDYGCGVDLDNCSGSFKGPITVLNYLNSQINNETKTWSNIDQITSYTYNNNLNGTTNTHGYQKLEITNGTGKLISKDGLTTTVLTGTMRARLLTYEEIIDLANANGGTIPNWLYTNLSFANTSAAPLGYWLLTVDSSDPSYSYYGQYMSYKGELNRDVVYSNIKNGARPVITLSK